MKLAALIHIFLFLACFCAAAPLALAQEAPSAVGRITFGGQLTAKKGICTGTLVAPDLVLTAGHCIKGAVNSAQNLYFAADYVDGKSLAVRPGLEVILPQSDEAGANRFVNDVALLMLEEAVPRAVVEPLSVIYPTADSFSFIAYQAARPERPVQDDTCEWIDGDTRMMGLTCPVFGGNSGAPVLQRDGERWQVAGVMVARTNKGRVRALAAIVPASLRKVIESRNAR
jgi:hypothetical protein